MTTPVIDQINRILERIDDSGLAIDTHNVNQVLEGRPPEPLWRGHNITQRNAWLSGYLAALTYACRTIPARVSRGRLDILNSLNDATRHALRLTKSAQDVLELGYYREE